MMKAIQKSSENTNTKTKTMTKTTTKTKTHEKCLKTQHMLYFWNPDDLLIPNMMIDTSPWSSCSHRSPWSPCSSLTFSSTGPSVSPFRDFFLFLLTPWHQKWEHRVCILQTMSICNGYRILYSQASGRSVWSSLHIIPDVSAETRWLLGCSKFGSEFFLEMHYDPNW